MVKWVLLCKIKVKSIFFYILLANLGQWNTYAADIALHTHGRLQTENDFNVLWLSISASYMLCISATCMLSAIPGPAIFYYSKWEYYIKKVNIYPCPCILMYLLKLNVIDFTRSFVTRILIDLMFPSQQSKIFWPTNKWHESTMHWVASQNIKFVFMQ